ncbi:MAG: hypothetical protein QW201_02225 [Thermoproteota archaeon]
MKVATTLIFVALLVLAMLAWAPWLDNKEIHDMVLREKGKLDGTIQPIDKVVASEEALRDMMEYSRIHGITDGILICDYKVMWLPFGRWVASCEGGYYVTFWGQILP